MSTEAGNNETLNNETNDEFEFVAGEELELEEDNGSEKEGEDDSFNDDSEEEDQESDEDSEDSDEEDESDDIDDEDDEEESDEAEEEASAKTEEKPVNEAPQKDTALEEEVDAEIKANFGPELIPDTPEFIESARLEAIKMVEQTLGEEYFDADGKHQAYHQVYFNKVMANRKAAFNNAVTDILAKKHAQKAQVQLENQINSILVTPEDKKRLGEALNKLSHGTYVEIERALAKGDSSKLIALAKKVAGVHGRLLNNEKPRKANNSPRKKGEIYGSDILGF